MAPNTLTTVVLASGFACCVVAGPVPYKLDALDRSRYDAGTLNEIERRREHGESDVGLLLLLLYIVRT